MESDKVTKQGWASCLANVAMIYMLETELEAVGNMKDNNGNVFFLFIYYQCTDASYEGILQYRKLNRTFTNLHKALNVY